MSTTPAVKQLPTLKELHGDIEVALKNDEFNLLLNQPPVTNWVREHPVHKNVKYLPIEKIELMLTRIFQEWRAEVMAYSQLFNSVSCHIRLHYKNPLTGIWSFHDGLGAVGIQTDKGEAASNLNAIKQDAVMKALPAAKSYAIKDAAEHLGSLFGRDLNRKDVIGFTMAYNDSKSGEVDPEIKFQFDLCTDVEGLEKYFAQLPAQITKTVAVRKAFTTRKEELTPKN